MGWLVFLLLPTMAQAQVTVVAEDLPAVVGTAPSGLFGRQIVSGDLDGLDGVDLAVATLTSDVHIFTNRFATDPAWPSDELLVPDAPTADWLRIEGPADSLFGASVAYGDVDHDGFGDLVVGAPLDSVVLEEDGPSVSDVGRVYVFTGPFTGEPRTWEDADVVLEGDQWLGTFGAAVAVFDLDADGDDELWIGQPRWSEGLFVRYQAGAVHVFDGVEPGTFSPEDADRTLRGDSTNDFLGIYLQPVFLGAEAVDQPSVAVYEGGDTTLWTSAALTPLLEDALPADPSEGRLGSIVGLAPPLASPPERHALAGIWVPERPDDPSESGALLHFLPDTPWADAPDASQAALRLEGDPDTDGSFGDQAVFGDVTGDGVEDLLVSSPGWQSASPDPFDPAASGVRAGAAWLFDGCHFDDPGAEGACVGAPSGTAVASDLAWFGLVRRQLGAGIELPNDLVGQTVAVVDGRIAVGAPRTDDDRFGEDVGALHVVRLDADGDGSLYWQDCDDADPTVFPGAEELCDAVQQDCDVPVPADHADADGDGTFGCAGDCDDADPSVHPAAEEQPCSGVDDDCDGALSPGELDGDGDGSTPCAGDCDDTLADVHPAADELCDTADNDCDGTVDEGYDADGDGFPGGLDCAAGLPELGLDCDDEDPAVHPGAADGPGGADFDCVPGDVWAGGCACSTTESSPPWFLLLALGAFLFRRRGGYAALALVPLTELTPVATGDPDLQLPAAITAMETPDGPALMIGSPARDVAVSGSGGVLRISADATLPAALDGGDLVCGGELTNLASGTSLSAGDVDGDGLDDLLIGARGRQRIEVVPGDSLPVGPSEHCGTAFTGTRGVNLFHVMGENVLGVDLDDDGFTDVIAGDRAEGGQGVVQIWYGAQDFFDGAPDEGELLGTDPLGDDEYRVGAFVSAVDWTCDGRPDLATGGLNLGLQLLINPGGLRPWDSLTVNSSTAVSYTGDFVWAQTQVVQLPDVTGNGCADVLLGLPGWHADDRGAVAIVEGTASPVSDIGVDEVAWWFVEGDPGEQLGMSVAWADWTGGARPDLLLGAPGGLDDAGAEVGRVYALAAADVPWPDGPDATTSLDDHATVVFTGWRGGDGFGASSVPWQDLDGDGLPDLVVGAPGARPLDVDDSQAPYPGALLALESSSLLDADGDGAPALLDCDDDDPDVAPSSEEVCGGGDEDCDGAIDEPGALGEQTWHPDLDGDGFGDPSEPLLACDAPDRVLDGSDCDDSRASVSPGSDEACDGLDSDCDGATPDDEIDADGDGFLACAECDDADPTAHPLASELLCDGRDEDCDGLVDEPFDRDGDGFVAGEGCEDAHDALDCDDNNPHAQPGATELPGNGLDDDCDGSDQPVELVLCSCSTGASSAGSLLLLPLLARRRRRR